MRWIAGLAVFVMLLTAAKAEAAEPLASVPYRVDYNGWYTIDVNVNGQGPYHFIVDTGATLTAVFENITATQSFSLVADDGEKRILGVTGAQTLPASLIGDIEIGGLELNDHVGVVIPDWDEEGDRPHGVLGLDFLARYVVYFNAVDSVIEFYHPDHPPTDVMETLTSTRLRYSTFNKQHGGLYTVNVRMSGRNIPCIFDLGAAGTLINYRAMRRMLGGLYIDAHRDTGASTGSKIRDVFGDEESARAFRAGPIKIAGARWSRKTLIVYNAGIFQELGLHRKSYGLLGSDLVRDRNFIVDFQDERFYISRKAVVNAS